MFSKKVKFSIIMPTYNRAFCIQKAIDSLLTQTYQEFELIIIDDGSTDDTEKLIKEKYLDKLHNKKIIYKKLKQNKGVCKARNIGLKLAHNSWIGYIDSDNEMLPDFLETFKKSIIENPKNKIFYSQLQRTDGQVIGQPFNYENLQEANFIDLGVFVHNKSLIQKYGKFDTNLRRLVDWDLILRYTRKEKPVFIEKVLLKYSENNNYSRITNTESLQDAKLIIDKKRAKERFLKNIFSVKNKDVHKVITVVGLKFKIVNIKLLKKELTMLKNETFCPVCGGQNTLISGGTVSRKNAVCSKCGSFERHRFLYFIYNFLFLNTSKKIKLLHIAPEKNLYNLIKRNQLIEYTAIDINPEQYPFAQECIQGDVRHMPFEDKSFDVIIHNQVMEHIVEEKQFVDECIRVLKDNGIMIVNIPYSPNHQTTFEDINVTAEDERENLYYQKDHVRLYGNDMFKNYDYLDITRFDESIMSNKLANIMHLKRETTQEKTLLDAYFVIRKKYNFV